MKNPTCPTCGTELTEDTFDIHPIYTCFECGFQNHRDAVEAEAELDAFAATLTNNRIDF
jgi:hypothetical protein